MSVFAKSVLNVKNTPAGTPPPLMHALRVEDVAEGSPAQSLGIQAGDFLLAVNSTPALNADVEELLLKGRRVDYGFYQPRAGQSLSIQTKALPLGIRTAPTSDGIVRKYRAEKLYGADDWFVLWERGDFEHLRQAAIAAQATSFVGKLLGKGKPFPPAELMIAVSDIEAGRLEEGFSGLAQFEPQMHKWTTDFHALVYYYRALAARRAGDMSKARELIAFAIRANGGSRRIKALAEEMGVRSFDDSQLLGRCPKLDGTIEYIFGRKGQTRLTDILNEMPEGQILPLCLMASYRGNGPYDRALGAYIYTWPHLSEILHPMVVLTDVKDRRKSRPHWLENEDLARKKKIPLLGCYDPESAFSEAFNLRAAPVFHALNKSGTVIWSGDLMNDFGYWQMIANREAFD